MTACNTTGLQAELLVWSQVSGAHQDQDHKEEHKNILPGCKTGVPHLSIDCPEQDCREEYRQHPDHTPHLLHLLECESSQTCTHEHITGTPSPASTSFQQRNKPFCDTIRMNSTEPLCLRSDRGEGEWIASNPSPSPISNGETEWWSASNKPNACHSLKTSAAGRSFR